MRNCLTSMLGGLHCHKLPVILSLHRFIPPSLSPALPVPNKHRAVLEQTKCSCCAHPFKALATNCCSVYFLRTESLQS